MTEEKVRLLRSMGQSIDPKIIESTLQFVFEGVSDTVLDEVHGGSPDVVVFFC